MYYTNGLIARLKFISNIEKIDAAHFTISLLLQITSTKGATHDYSPDRPSTGVLSVYSSLYYESYKNMGLTANRIIIQCNYYFSRFLQNTQFINVNWFTIIIYKTEQFLKH